MKANLNVFWIATVLVIALTGSYAGADRNLATGPGENNDADPVHFIKGGLNEMLNDLAGKNGPASRINIGDINSVGELGQILGSSFLNGMLTQLGSGAEQSSNLDISGDWKTSLGPTVKINQSGNTFTWACYDCKMAGLTGSGTINGQQLTTSWKDLTGDHSDEGTVTAFDQVNRATEIRWNSGVVYQRITEPEPPQVSPVADISGDWKSSLGPTVRVTQSNNTFTWECYDCKMAGLSGTGTINGQQLTTRWTDLSGDNSDNGTVTAFDQDNRATEITWNSGVIYKRITKSESPQISTVIDISGEWQSLLWPVVTISITQNGTSFTWEYNDPLNVQLSGNGTIADRALTINWTDQNGENKKSGSIISVNNANEAVEIDWLVGYPFQKVLESPSFQVPDISGDWKTNLGPTITITQNDHNYSWRCKDCKIPGLKGYGTIDDKKLTTTWTDNTGDHSDVGNISALDNGNKALEITWNSGVVYKRADNIQASPIIDLSGEWRTNLGPKVQIVQKGTDFTWSCQELGLDGTGIINGLTLNASWTDQKASHSAGGKFIEGITWDNGLFFHREVNSAAWLNSDLSGKWKTSNNSSIMVAAEGQKWKWSDNSVNLHGYFTNDKGKLRATFKNGQYIAQGEQVNGISWDNGIIWYRSLK